MSNSITVYSPRFPLWCLRLCLRVCACACASERASRWSEGPQEPLEADVEHSLTVSLVSHSAQDPWCKCGVLFFYPPPPVDVFVLTVCHFFFFFSFPRLCKKRSDPVEHKSVRNFIQRAETFQTRTMGSAKQLPVACTLFIFQSLKRYISVSITNLSNLSVFFLQVSLFQRHPQHFHFFVIVEGPFPHALFSTIGLRYSTFIVKWSIASLEALYSSG